MKEMKTANDFYEMLGIEKDATIGEIKKAYRKRARDLHPDLNKNKTNDEFIKLVKAYEILSDPNRRDNYDKLGYEGTEELDINKLSIGMIQNIFTKLLNENEIIFEKQDIFKTIEKFIKNTTLEQNKLINKFKKRIKFLEKVKKRITFKKENKVDFITKIILLEIENLKNEIKKNEFSITINNKAIETLKDYNYEFDFDISIFNPRTCTSISF